jgi:type I restriction enzyme S subunit
VSWKRKKLGDILEIQNGYAFDSKLFSFENGKPLIRIRDIKNGIKTEANYIGDFDSKYVVTRGDFLIGMDGEFACYEWKGDDALLNQRVCRLHNFKNDIFPKFLFYGINNYLKSIEDNTTFTTVKHISSKQIADIEFPLPPLIEQKKIVEKIDTLFAEIKKAVAATEANIKNTEVLFQSYLTQIFERAGEGWVITTLDKICKVDRGSSPRPIKNYFTTNEDGVNWIKIGDTEQGGKYIYSTNQKITKEGAEKSRYVEVGDFILSNSMSFGRPYIMRINGYIHDGWFVLRLNKDIDAEYFYYLLTSPYVQNQFKSLSAGSVVKNISGDLVKKTILSIPKLNEQKRLTEIFSKKQITLKELSNIYMKRAKELLLLKQSILKQAFNGNFN